MELDTYVSTTLQQIVRGVQEAQEAVAGAGGQVNPLRHGLSQSQQSGGRPVQDVTFDVVVTVAEDKESGAGLRVGIPGTGIGAGLKGGSGSQSSAENRIRFKVPLVLPLQSDTTPDA